MEHDSVDEGQKHLGARTLLCGIDLVEYTSFRRNVEMGGDRFLERYYTEAEREYCQGRIPCLGARFAVKEAVAKALGTGFRGVRPIEIETLNFPQGKPSLQLYGQAAMTAKQIGVEDWEISLSHEPSYAIAIAIAVKQGYGTDGVQRTVMDTIEVALHQKSEASGAFDEATKEFTTRFQKKGERDG